MTRDHHELGEPTRTIVRMGSREVFCPLSPTELRELLIRFGLVGPTPVPPPAISEFLEILNSDAKENTK